jgi:uncharacterized protein YlxW (UPF0749 family)
MGRLVGYGRDKEPMEPVVKSYDGLAKAQAKFIKQLADRQVLFDSALASQIRDNKAIKKTLGRKIGSLKREVKECQGDRERLQARIETLESNSKSNHDYTKEYSHALNNLLTVLPDVLKKHGIEPTAIEHVVKDLNEHRTKKLNLPPI